jgi:hypothetical protein
MLTRVISRGMALCAVLVFAWIGQVYAQEAAYGTSATEIAEKIAAAFPTVAGRVIGLEQERILLDIGGKDKVIPGLELQVYRDGQEFKHPYTGQVLGKLDRDVARIRVMEVQPNFSVAEVIQQSEGTMVQQGDSVRMTSARIVLALPNVDVGDISGTNPRSITRDLTNALIKTNRFEVLADQRIRAALTDQKLTSIEQFTEPAALRALWKQLRVSAVLLAKLSVQEKTVRWDVQVLSTVRGDTITLASSEVKGAAPGVAGTQRSAGFVGEMAPRIDQIALRSQDLEFRGKAMAVGDLTGDGTTKVAVTDGVDIHIYDLAKNGVKELATIRGEKTDNVLALDAADINGNGVAEIFVTNFSLVHQTTYQKSYVLEYQDGKWVKTWDNVHLFFRVLDAPDGKPRLFAQASGTNYPFEGPVREYVWQADKYVPASTSPLALPKDFNRIYGFLQADLDGAGAPKTLVLDRLDYLRLYDKTGEIYRSSDRFGGSENLAEYATGQSWTDYSGDQGLGQIMIQSRMFYVDPFGEGKKQLIVARNTPSTGYTFRTRMYDKGKIFGLNWDGLGMQVMWETRELPGYIADFSVADVDGSGTQKLVLLVVPTNLIGMGKGRCFVTVMAVR